jgi:hypothetical protein
VIGDVPVGPGGFQQRVMRFGFADLAGRDQFRRAARTPVELLPALLTVAQPGQVPDDPGEVLPPGFAVRLGAGRAALRVEQCVDGLPVQGGGPGSAPSSSYGLPWTRLGDASTYPPLALKSSQCRNSLPQPWPVPAK